MTEPDHDPMRITDCMVSFQLRNGGDANNYTGDTLILVPGLGCDKTWYQWAFRHFGLQHTAIVSFDLPNQGDLAPARTPKPLWSGGLRFLHQWVTSIYDLTAQTGKRFHLVAHSMGNIPALMAWRSIPKHARGAFIAIEGNLTSQDCFASSRMAVSVNATEAFIDEMRASTRPDLRGWGNDLLWCDPEYLHLLARDTVSICETDELTHRWEFLKHAHYLYGEHSGYPEHHRNLFESTNTTVTQIPASGHFPMFTNKHATWDAVAQAVRSTHDR